MARMPVRKYGQAGRRPTLQETGEGANCSTTDLTPTLRLAVFRPGSRGPFVAAKGPKAIDAQSGLMRSGNRGNRMGGPTRYAHTRPAIIYKASAHGAEQQASVRRKTNGEIYGIWSCNHAILFRHRSTFPKRVHPLSYSKT